MVFGEGHLMVNTRTLWWHCTVELGRGGGEGWHYVCCGTVELEWEVGQERERVNLNTF